MTKRIRPLFSYFGAKWTLAPRYPAPRHDLIVEPFAGSACYSLLHHERDVLLIDANPDVVDTWRYLLSASPSEILDLPDLPASGIVSELGLPRGPELLVRWWVNNAQGAPGLRASTWAKQYPERFWGPRIRARLANAVPRIAHWRVRLGYYSDAAIDAAATYFIDPPYQGRAGRRYLRFGSQHLDYGVLGDWCRGVDGQAIVCEMAGADWLPFVSFSSAATATNAAHGRRIVREVVWTNDRPVQGRLL